MKREKAPLSMLLSTWTLDKDVRNLVTKRREQFDGFNNFPQ